MRKYLLTTMKTRIITTLRPDTLIDSGRIIWARCLAGQRQALSRDLRVRLFRPKTLEATPVRGRGFFAFRPGKPTSLHRSLTIQAMPLGQ
jgi:hypothetical protein